MRNIHFLSFMNRSGSTLLAKELNKYRDIAVSIEGLEKRSLKYDPEKFFLNNEEEITNWLDFIYKNGVKFKKWGLNKNTIRRKLLSKHYPINFNEFFTIALNLYFKNNPARVLIHKGGGYFNNLSKSEKVYSDSKYIFIDRDPRAIYNSLRKTQDSITGKIMNDNILSFAIAYKNLQNRIKYYKKNTIYKDKFIRVFYDNLVRNNKSVIDKIINFFNLSKYKKNENNNYYNLIPNEQKYLHKNINKKMMRNRIYAWRDELDSNDIYFLEKVLKNQIIMNGYRFEKLYFKNLNNKIDILKKLLKFAWKYYPKAISKKILIIIGLRDIW